MSFEIRIASCDDLPLLIHLYAEMDGELPLSSDRAAEIFAQMMQVPNYDIYLAYLNQEPIGTFSLLYVPTMMHRGYHKFAVLDAVTVSPKFRGQGIGNQMMKAAIQMSADAGCYKVTLSSNLKRDRAHQFYQSLGFEQHGWSFKCVVNQGNGE
ncbi:acetyltransferase [Nostoc sp. PCC 7524]|uniref:GNAT family N-acetyltransferase n=1 Tax=Nostoc sp. (strain ATCC 29411 / PCC 7524) TaxID=28072 RepID=UPI00029EDC61|nr:GNAT family N-acetyltransferase [Nostoc sp. PCC 7524]AFY46639.1 acetyltransferase [Nostoc sp. PCC 7524]